MGWKLGAIALLAILVRALVPAGYMLTEAEGVDGSRYLTLEICEDHGTPQRLVDLDTGDVIDAADLERGDSTQNAAAPCVFAASAHLAPPLQASTLLTFVVATSAPRPEASDVRPGRGIAAPPPPATGPPSII